MSSDILTSRLFTTIIETIVL